MDSIRRKTLAALSLTFTLALGAAAAAQTATVNLSTPRQSIRGFGGINHPVWAGDLTADQRTTAFGNGPGQLGMTVLRIFVSDNRNDWTREVATAKRALELGAIVFASPWNPPSSMTEIVNGQKRLRHDQYAAYATHLNDFDAFMKSNGVNLYALSIQNEPDYAKEWTAWTQDEVYDFVLNDAGSLTAARVITPESFNYTKSYYDKILNDPKALANVDIIGTHLYGTPVSAFPYPLFDQKGAGKERWMTEHYTDSSNDADLWPMALDVAYEMHNAMVEAQFNAYVWWYIRRSYGPMKENGQLSKRGFCFAQFSKFIRPGFTRVDATKNPTTDVYVSAYKGNSDVVMVVVNRATSSKSLTLSVPGTTISSFERYTTSSTKSLSSEGEVQASNGSLMVTLDAQSVTTLRGTGDGSSGGSPGTGGSANSGGSVSTGGIANTGGAAGRGGGTSSGGSGARGGSANAGGSATSGGRSDGGAGADGSASGGLPGAGGSIGPGGSVSTEGGDPSSGGSDPEPTTGGSPGAGGTSSSGGSPSTGGADASNDGNCGCHLPGEGKKTDPLGFLSVLGLIALGTLRRSRLARRARLPARAFG